MEWSEVVEHPSLQDLPFKIETNENGEIIMNPVKLKHSAYQGEIEFLMRTLRRDGIAMPECAIKTSKGTKAADVAWFSFERWRQVRDEADASIAPEVCVEVVSMSNSDREIKEKRKPYFERGALEVWVCDEYGAVQFYNANRKLKRSQLFPDFPSKVVVI